MTDQKTNQSPFQISGPGGLKADPLDQTLSLPLSSQGMEKYLYTDAVNLLKL